MTLVIASCELSAGNVLSFRTFPTQPHSLSFTLTFHVEGGVTGEIAYRVRKWGDVVAETGPLPFHLAEAAGHRLLTHAASLPVVFPSQGAYLLDILFDGSLLHSLPFSVFDSSQRTALEREILYYLKAKRGARSVQEITRGVFNPNLLNKANMREMSGKVYLALLRMQEVSNLDPDEHSSLEERMDRSRWQLKE